MLTISILSYPQEIESVVIAIMTICVIAIPWFIVCRKFDHSKFTVVCYPLVIALTVIAGFHSLITYSLGVTSWKRGRMVGGRR